MKRIIYIIVCTIFVISINAQTVKIENIRALFNKIEKQIKEKELVETKIDFDANEYPYDGMPGFISFWEEPYNGKGPIKISSYNSYSLISNRIEFYYYADQKLFFIYKEIDNYNNRTMDQYRLYLDEGKMLQFIVVNIENGKEKLRKSYTDTMNEDLDSIKKEMLRLSEEYLKYYRVVNKIPK